MERISEFLESIVPNTKRVATKKHGNKLSLEFTQEWVVAKQDGRNRRAGASGAKPEKVQRSKFEGFGMSDGTLRAIGLLTAVFQKPQPSVLVIEEPEATIHPGPRSGARSAEARRPLHAGDRDHA